MSWNNNPVTIVIGYGLETSRKCLFMTARLDSLAAPFPVGIGGNFPGGNDDGM
jgi:hypothetical protein